MGTRWERSFPGALGRLSSPFDSCVLSMHMAWSMRPLPEDLPPGPEPGGDVGCRGRSGRATHRVGCEKGVFSSGEGSLSVDDRGRVSAPPTPGRQRVPREDRPYDSDDDENDLGRSHGEPVLLPAAVTAKSKSAPMANATTPATSPPTTMQPPPTGTSEMPRPVTALSDLRMREVASPSRSVGGNALSAGSTVRLSPVYCLSSTWASLLTSLAITECPAAVGWKGDGLIPSALMKSVASILRPKT